MTLTREFEDKNYFKLVCYYKNRIQPIESIFFTFSKIFINVQSLTTLNIIFSWNIITTVTIHNVIILFLFIDDSWRKTGRIEIQKNSSHPIACSQILAKTGVVVHAVSIYLKRLKFCYFGDFLSRKMHATPHNCSYRSNATLNII